MIASQTGKLNNTLTNDEYLKHLQQSEACCQQQDDSELCTSHQTVQARKMRMNLNIYLGVNPFFWPVDNLKCLLTTRQRVMVPVPRIHVSESGSQIAHIKIVNSNQIGQN